MSDELFVDGVALSSYPCIVRKDREGMTDADFWAAVFPSGGFGGRGPESDLQYETVSLDADPCPECGEAGACDYDTYGRALIHVTSEDDQ